MIWSGHVGEHAGPLRVTRGTRGFTTSTHRVLNQGPHHPSPAERSGNRRVLILSIVGASTGKPNSPGLATNTEGAGFRFEKAWVFPFFLGVFVLAGSVPLLRQTGNLSWRFESSYSNHPYKGHSRNRLHLTLLRWQSTCEHSNSCCARCLGITEKEQCNIAGQYPDISLQRRSYSEDQQAF